MKNILIFSTILLTVGCGSSSSTRVGGGEAGGGVDTETGGASGSIASSVGGSDVSSVGGTDFGIGGNTSSGGSDVGTGGENASGGAGNTGGNCEPWNCTNIAIQLAGWSQESGDPVPEACGLVQDPCTGQYLDCGGCSANKECGAPNLDLEATYYPDSVVEIPGNPNLCGGNCDLAAGSATFCENYPAQQYYYCNIERPPHDECVGSGHFYCCNHP